MTNPPVNGRRPDDTVPAFLADFAATIQRHNLSLRAAEQRVPWSKSTISRAINGTTLPKPELIVDVLTAAGLPAQEITAWKARHAALAAEPVAAPEEVVPPVPVPRRRLIVAGIAIALTAAALATLGTLVITQNRSTANPPSSTTPQADRPMVLEVQNKVALGASDLREDTTPVYLSTRTIGSCSRHGCKLEDTEVTSGALLVAVCHTVGAELVNYNLDAPESKTNPNAARSTLWYRIQMPGGSSGYLSEVYVKPRDRGGLGLPNC
ncbi:helix-turn-helix transcriptional regulator [Lentzea sp. NPDC051838]|uniref:helix-turn-helix domain-containing protein n=1 Tax=Lentzea sp. NPDC051838 TaxID=3154849 RepID=UPI00342A9B60